jgi:hypothetical protein
MASPVTRCIVLVALSLAAPVFAADQSDLEERWRLVMRLARERNDRDLVAAVDQVGRVLKAGHDSAVLTEVERRVGIDPGGWSMAGLPIFHPTAAMKARAPELAQALDAAMRAEDPAAVTTAVGEMRTVLGDQAGVPDARRPGRRAPVTPIGAAAATRLFVGALKHEEGRLRPLLEGKPLPDQMVRAYAYVLEACVRMRPLVAEHAPQELAWLDRLGAGTASVLLSLQQPDGHFPFPDLRGKNIRFGDLTERALNAGQVEVRAGWVVSVDPEGGSQFDTGLAGAALLRAGQLRENAAWIAAGQRAADWALRQRCCANFNYNAFSVSLLATAHTITGKPEYLAGAWKKYQVGVAPGQALNGRWIDAHNARTVYHVIILRALTDLAAILPADWTDRRAQLRESTTRAMEALWPEFDALGITVDALPEMIALARMYPADARLRAATQEMASLIIAKCTDGRRVKLGAQPEQLASVAHVTW